MEAESRPVVRKRQGWGGVRDVGRKITKLQLHGRSLGDLLYNMGQINGHTGRLAVPIKVTHTHILELRAVHTRNQTYIH
jgi:hypothetical protein